MPKEHRSEKESLRDAGGRNQVAKEKTVATSDGKNPIQKSLLGISGTSLYRERPLADT